jgi:hypothetical protein
MGKIILAPGTPVTSGSIPNDHEEGAGRQVGSPPRCLGPVTIQARHGQGRSGREAIIPAPACTRPRAQRKRLSASHPSSAFSSAWNF